MSIHYLWVIVLPKSSYEEQISEALCKSKKTYKSPAAKFAAVLDALGERVSIPDLDREWAAFYARTLQEENDALHAQRDDHRTSPR